MIKNLVNIQNELKAPKSNFNSFGKYRYRSAEDILTGVKPLLQKYSCTMTVSDEIVFIGNRFYIKATVMIADEEGNTESVSAFAREDESKKGMDGSQITGTASSYAGKRALGNLFAIDDTKDSDALPTGPAQKAAPAQGPFSAKCRACGHVHQFSDRENYEQWLAYWAQGGDQNRCCPAPSLEVM